MNILVVNAGSSSLKIQLFKNGKTLECHYKALVDRIGTKEAMLRVNELTPQKISSSNHQKALKVCLDNLIKEKIIASLQDIQLVGHRVVHGGEHYTEPTLINQQVCRTIKKLFSLAPLHNPPNLSAILACQKLLPHAKQIAVFDTAFHQTMPEKAYRYALPYELSKKYGLRRYGFHGTSHRYVAIQTQKLLHKKNAKIITCHLGNGSSITAIKNGQSLDTSMGYTPIEGLPMGTRCGDIDPGIVLELSSKKGFSAEKVYNLLYHDSGLKGLFGKSSDMRDIWQASKKNTRAKLALEVLAYRMAKYIGAYSATLNGLDAITFTGGIGENAWYLRQQTCDYLSFLGLKLDPKKNQKNAETISAIASRIKVLVIPTNEEKQIAIEVLSAIKSHK